MKTSHILYLLFSWFLPVLVLAQPQFSINTYSGYTNNAFYNHNQYPDYYTWINGYANYDRIGDQGGLRLYYDGSATLYNQYQDKNYQLHTLGLSFYHYYHDEQIRLNAGTSLGSRQHSDAYQWYEMNTLNAYANTKIVLANQLFGYSGMDIDYNYYPNLDPFTHLQTRLYLRLSRFFDTGTTLIAESSLMSKFYKSEGDAAAIEGFPEIITVGDNNSQQLLLQFKAAQGLTPKTGLSGGVTLRHNLTNSTRYLGSVSGYYYSDEEILNDVFGYHSTEYDLKFKQLLPWKSTLSVGGSVMFRDYENRLALDIAGNPFPDFRTRQDDRYSLWLTLQKQLRLASSMAPLTLTFGFTNIENQSNDLYYDYHVRNISFSIDQAF